MKLWVEDWDTVRLLGESMCSCSVYHNTDRYSHIDISYLHISPIFQVESVLMHVATSEASKKARQRGMDQRNMAIDWVREQCTNCTGSGLTCQGVIYFMDDDNTYDLRLFEQVRQVFWGRGGIYALQIDESL